MYKMGPNCWNQQASTYSILMLNDRYQVHLDYITLMDFLHTIYRGYEDVISAVQAYWLGHMLNCDTILGKVKKGFKQFDTVVISEQLLQVNFRSPPCTVSRKST